MASSVVAVSFANDCEVVLLLCLSSFWVGFESSGLGGPAGGHQ